MGIPVVTVSYIQRCPPDLKANEQAPGEAEAQCAELARGGKVRWHIHGSKRR